MHYFPQMTMKDILWGRSYANVVMLMSSIPSHTPENGKTKEANELEIKNISEVKDLL